MKQLRLKGFSPDQMLLGGWVAPPNAAYGGTDYISPERFREIRESGINVIYTMYRPETDFEDLRRAADFAKSAGVFLMVGDDRFSKEVTDEAALLELLAFCREHPAVVGVNACDEPGSNRYRRIAENYRRFKPYLGELLFYVNHMPIYATGSQLDGGWWTPEEAEATNQNYDRHIESFMEIVGTDMLSFDFYPFRWEKMLSDFRYFEQLFICKRIADKYGVPLWNFIQLTSWNKDVVRNTTYSEILWQVSTAVACGVTGIQYFCYWTPVDSGGEYFLNAMIDARGGKTKSYHFVKKVNRHLQAIAPYILRAEHKGVIAYGNTVAPVPRENNLGMFGNLVNIAADGMLIGCFELDGKNMYYVVNTSLDESKVLTLKFGKPLRFTTVREDRLGETQGDVFCEVLYEGEGVLLIEQ